MLQMLLRFLPADKRAMIQLAMRMVAKLDTPAERKAVAEYGIAAFKDGSVSITEWATIGGKLGILTGPRKNGNGG
tara:strand:- start:209 stop:433 length:225 start_codon:yes stop_codon:yes gene_type:complete